MTPVLLSQRVEVYAERGERRDAVDQRLVDWLADCGYLAVPLPNRPELLEAYWRCVQPSAVVLSGGNDLQRYGGDAPERDATEHALLARCLEQGVPVFGLCRGMQLLLDAFGCVLQPVIGHVATRHRLQLEGREHEVNSYHQWGALEVVEPLQVLARSADGCVEAMRHATLPVVGIMWHPEREARPNDIDRQFVQASLGGNQAARH